MTLFFRITDVSPEDKPAALRAAIPGDSPAFEVESHLFARVPGSPFCYWASLQILDFFKKYGPLECPGRSVRQGLATADDFRFLRTAWEVPIARLGKAWRHVAKGGAFSPMYSDLPLVLDWNRDGAVLKAKVTAEHGNVGKRIYNESHYFRPGLSWPRRTQKGLNLRAMQAGCIFADKGPAVFVENDDPESLLSLLAITNSSTFRYLVALQMAFGSYEIGVIQRTPVPNVSSRDLRILATLAGRAHSLTRRLDATDETSHAFLLPPGVSERVTGFDRAAVEQGLQRTQREIDDAVFDLYKIDADGRAEIESAFDRSAPPGSAAGDTEDADETDDADTEVADEDSVAPVLSWLVGVAFGRFDARLATGERAVPPEPEPFDPLPARSPGMWPADEERPVPPPDILVDDPGHARDIGAQVSSGAALVGVAEPEGLRRWLAREFFPLHIRMYSKSRRKAPIYWQLATPSASYSVWLYIHAFSRDTLFRVQNDYLVPKLRHEENKLEALNREAGEKAAAAQRRVIADQDVFVGELRGFLDEVKRVAPLWDPDLDDGVIINFAPLWRLVPHHRPWQKELKATWDALCTGKYDWSHLAMRLWPERVVPKCATDRSLAIAHGLEDVFWAQLRDKWVSREIPPGKVDELVAERTSDAVKAALRSLLDAPDGTPGRSGRGRAARGSRGGR